MSDEHAKTRQRPAWQSPAQTVAPPLPPRHGRSGKTIHHLIGTNVHELGNGKSYNAGGSISLEQNNQP